METPRTSVAMRTPPASSPTKCGATMMSGRSVVSSSRSAPSTRTKDSTSARVLMTVTEQTDEGYLLHIGEPWDDFPGPNLQEDTARMNREIERWVRRMPDQYLWTHRRFKTRPPGQAPFY